MKRSFLLLLMLLPILLFANVITIPDIFTTIQDGIDNSSQGDTILVLPGTYYENLYIENKSNITICSLQATTGDTTYVSSTIINGSNEINPVVYLHENVTNCIIQGISLTGGSGIAFSSEGIDSWLVYGGGMYIRRDIDIELKNLLIFGNKASKGGGIYFGKTNVNVVMSNVDIFNNIGRFSAGGVCFSAYNGSYSNVIFDQVDRCSIYNNYSPIGMDIGWNYNGLNTIDVYLDLFSWFEPNKYYVNAFEFEDVYPNINPHPIFDIQRTYITPIENDLYVSINGDDNNTGLTPEEPLRTTWKAFQKINPSESNPLTVHLLEGDFIEEINGVNTSIVLKENSRLKGMSSEQSHIFANNLVSTPVSAAVSLGNHQENMIVEDIAITVQNGSAIGGYTCFNAEIDNVLIENCSNNSYYWSLILHNGTNGNMSISNTTIKNNSSELNSGIYATIGSIELFNVSFDNNSSIEQDDNSIAACGVYSIMARDNTVIRDCKFTNNSFYGSFGVSCFRHLNVDRPTYLEIDNCIYSNNVVTGEANSIIAFGDFSNVAIHSSTFANNSGVDEHFLVATNQMNVYNSIFSNNSGHSYQLGINGNSNIDNCIFTNTTNIYDVYQDDPINFGVNNLIGIDPLFVGGDPAFPEYYYLSGDDTEVGPSPAIDAGTMDLSLFPANYEFPLYDLAGEDRIYGSTIDIGCYEFPGYTNAQDDVTSLKTYSLTNYPNPFNPTTNISFTIPVKSKVEIAIYNVKGQRIRTLCDEEMERGEHRIVWNGKNDSDRVVSSGIYFCKMRSRNKSITIKMVLMK